MTHGVRSLAGSKGRKQNKNLIKKCLLYEEDEPQSLPSRALESDQNCEMFTHKKSDVQVSTYKCQTIIKCPYTRGQVVIRCLYTHKSQVIAECPHKRTKCSLGVCLHNRNQRAIKGYTLWVRHVRWHIYSPMSVGH